MNKLKRAVALLLSGVVLSTTILLTAGAANNSTDEQTSASIPADADYIDGEAVVCMKTQPVSYSLRSRRSANNSFGANIPGFECEELMTIDTIDDEQEEEDYIPMLTSSKSIGLPSALSLDDAQTSEKTIMLVKSSSMDTQTLIDTLEDDPNVEFAEPNYIYSVSSTASDEPYYGDQWYLNNDGSHSYTSGNDLNADSLYENVTTGSDDVVVAVIDTGVDYTHEDLKDRMWDQGLNYSELKAMGGGEYGYCAIESYVNSSYDDIPVYNSDDPYDDNSHGTHCAGIIAAAWNGKGIAGLSDNVKIMAVKAGDGLGSLSNSSILKGFSYVDKALDCGVNIKVINNSYGGSYFGAALEYAIEQCGAKGALSVFAAGNSGTNLDVSDPDHLNSQYAVRIAASNSSGTLAGFSNYGSQKVDTAAPGAFILSSVPEELGAYIPELMPAEATKSLNNFDDSSSVHISDQSGSAEFAEADKGYSGKGLSISIPSFSPSMSDDSGYDENTYIQSVVNDATNFDIFEAFPGILDVTFDNVPQNLDNTYFAAKIYGKDVESVVILLYYDTELGFWTNGEYNIGANINNDSWGYFSANIPATADIKNHGIKLLFMSKTGEAAQYDYIIDDIALGEGTIPYLYKDGTSMACPAAVGVAAFLVSAGVDDPMELKARLIGGVQRSEALSDLVVSQGILDAEKAYYNPEAVVNSIQQQDDKIIISGYFFGEDEGTATMTGTSLDIEQWSDNEIVCKVPENAKSGNYEFRVTAADGRTGREFLMFNGNDSEWKALSAENIRINNPEYENYSAEFAAANGDLYALMAFEHNGAGFVFDLYKYSIVDNSWQKLLTFDDKVTNVTAFCEIYGRLYMLCDTMEGTQLVYYNTKTDSLVTVNNNVQYSGAICGTDYNGKILVVGGYPHDDVNYSDDFDFIISDGEIQYFGYEIDPLDGSVTKSSIEIPEYFDSAKIKTVGDKIVYYYVPTMYVGSDYNGAYYYDGNDWTQLPLIANMADTRAGGFDFSITEKGVIMSGHVLQLDGNYVDVLEYNAEKGEWETNDNIFSTNDVFFIGGLAYDGQYYALSKVFGTTGGYEFKSLAVDTIDDPQLPEPQEEPTNPTDEPTNPNGDNNDNNQTKPSNPNGENPNSVNSNSGQTPQSDGKSLNTGDSLMQMCIAVVFFAAAFAVTVVCVRKKKKA